MTEKPKKFKHLKAISRRYFGSNIIDCNFVLLYKEEKIPLNDLELNLMHYWNSSEKVEIHLIQIAPEDNPFTTGLDDWEFIGGSNMVDPVMSQKNSGMSKDNSKVFAKENSKGINKITSNDVLFGDLSILTNPEKPMHEESILNEAFAKNEMENLISRVKNEALQELKFEKQKCQQEWETERTQLEEFYENKIVDTEKHLEELLLEKSKVDSRLVETRRELEKVTKVSEEMDIKITSLKEIEVRSKTLDEKVKELKQQKHQITKTREALKTELVEKNELNEKLDKDISALKNENLKLIEKNEELKNNFAEVDKAMEAKALAVEQLQKQLEEKKKEFEEAYKIIMDKNENNSKELNDFILNLQEEIEIYKKNEEKYLLDLQNFQEQVASQTEELAVVKENNQIFEEEVENLRKILQENNSEISALKEQLHSKNVELELAIQKYNNLEAEFCSIQKEHENILNEKIILEDEKNNTGKLLESTQMHFAQQNSE